MIAAVALLADAEDWGHMGDWGGGWMWLWGAAMMALFVVLVVWLVVWLVRAGTGQIGPGASVPRDPADRAREILAERYAKGELTTEEYRERISELE